MNEIMKRFLACSLLCATPVLAGQKEAKSAKQNVPCQESYCEVPKTCTKTGPCGETTVCELPPDLCRTINPGAGPRICCDWGDFRVEADFIYWKRTRPIPLCANGIGFTSPATTNADVDMEGSNFFPDFGYDPGFKIGAGFDFAHGGWDLVALYTWMHNSAYVNFKSDPAKDFTQYTTFIQPTLAGAVINSAQAKNKNTLHFVQVELGRDFYTSKYLALRPKAGVVAICFPNSYHATWQVIDNGTGNPSQIVYKTSGQSSGGGVMAGFDSTWFIAKQWSLLGKLAFMPTLVHTSVKADSNNTNLTTGVNLHNLDTEGSFHSVQSLCNVFLGAMWQKTFCCNNSRLSLSAGWEFFTGLQESYVGISTTIQRNNMSYQGLTADAKWDF